jgi:hypothetical protein
VFSFAVNVVLSVRIFLFGCVSNDYLKGSHMNCTIEQFEDVVVKFKFFAESVELELSSDAEGLRQELIVICAELLTTVREEIKAGADSIL